MIAKTARRSDTEKFWRNLILAERTEQLESEIAVLGEEAWGQEQREYYRVEYHLKQAAQLLKAMNTKSEEGLSKVLELSIEHEKEKRQIVPIRPAAPSTL